MRKWLAVPFYGAFTAPIVELVKRTVVPFAGGLVGVLGLGVVVGRWFGRNGYEN